VSLGGASPVRVKGRHRHISTRRDTSPLYDRSAFSMARSSDLSRAHLRAGPPRVTRRPRRLVPVSRLRGEAAAGSEGGGEAAAGSEGGGEETEEPRQLLAAAVRRRRRLGPPISFLFAAPPPPPPPPTEGAFGAAV
jgi:hypothetical protein